MRLSTCLGLFASTALLAVPGWAAYPDKPIRLVVTFAAGDVSDIVARSFSEPLTNAPGRPMVVDNQPGAGGTIGGNEVVRAAPDGYTLMRSNSTPLSIGPFTIPKQPYDPARQFTHVAMLGIAPVVIMTNPKSGPAALKDLGKFGNFGSGEPGSIGHIVDKMAKDALKVNVMHVPYRGGAPMTTDLVAGTIPVGIGVIAACVPMMKSGQIKLLAVTSRTRSPLAPDTPSVVQMGLPQLLAENYFGVSGPAGLPNDVTDRHHKTLADIAADPAMVKLLKELGIAPVKMKSAEFSGFVGKQINDWALAIKAADLKN